MCPLPGSEGGKENDLPKDHLCIPEIAQTLNVDKHQSNKMDWMLDSLVEKDWFSIYFAFYFCLFSVILFFTGLHKFIRRWQPFLPHRYACKCVMFFLQWLVATEHPHCLLQGPMCSWTATCTPSWQTSTSPCSSPPAGTCVAPRGTWPRRSSAAGSVPACSRLHL